MKCLSIDCINNGAEGCCYIPCGIGIKIANSCSHYHKQVHTPTYTEEHAKEMEEKKMNESKSNIPVYIKIICISNEGLTGDLTIGKEYEAKDDEPWFKLTNDRGKMAGYKKYLFKTKELIEKEKAEEFKELFAKLPREKQEKILEDIKKHINESKPVNIIEAAKSNKMCRIKHKLLEKCNISQGFYNFRDIMTTLSYDFDQEELKDIIANAEWYLRE